MHQHKADHKPGERSAGAPWWKLLLDEDRVGPAKAWRHRWWMQAGLVGVDHDGKEWWNLERPRDSDIPCTCGRLLSQAAEFFSHYFLEALLHMWPFCVRVCMRVCGHACMCVLWACALKTPFCKSSFLSVRNMFLNAKLLSFSLPLVTSLTFSQWEALFREGNDII